MTDREKGKEQDRGAKIRILVDIRAAFARNGDPLLLATETLLHTLNADPEAPWHEYGPDGLTARRLQMLLKDYEIGSANRRFPDGTQRRGYARADFADAWNRYCPAPEPAAPLAPPQSASPRVPGPGLPPAPPPTPGTGPRR
jgi:hypothetical protein